MVLDGCILKDCLLMFKISVQQCFLQDLPGPSFGLTATAGVEDLVGARRRGRKGEKI